MKRVLAFDFGASSGRAILGEYEGGRLTYKEVHRFENNPREQDGHLRWDFTDLMNNVRLGIEKAGAFDSIAFDTWGVDFGLLDEAGHLLEDPVHYRDDRTNGMNEQAEKTLPAADLYAATGCQIMSINTLFQLLAVQQQQPELWTKVRQLLFMPDLFAYALCGSRVCETTIASTSQMLDAHTGRWSKTVLDAFSVPESLFAPMVTSGTVVGEYKGAKVIAAAGHDTQCAVAALPAPQPFDQALLERIEQLKEAVSSVRNIRKEHNIPNKEALELYVIGDDNYHREYNPLLQKMANLNRVEEIAEKRSDAAAFIVKTTEYFVPLGGSIDVEEELKKLKADLAYQEGFLASVLKKLSNERFVQNAPAKVIETEHAKRHDAEAKIKALKERIDQLQ